MLKTKVLYILVLISFVTYSQNTITLNTDSTTTVINKHIYGHFAEHLGRAVYDGLYVGEDSKIPHINGIRKDAIDALKRLNIPNLRWPGGCFAEAYHWLDAVGPKDKRKPVQNMFWGHQKEDNSFGTNEFLALCKLLNAEPYLAVNMNSGSVDEAVKWLQYTSMPNGSSEMAELRVKHGIKEPWNVKYWGIGNESWGCGGNMKPEHYANLYKQYATLFNTDNLYRIAVGPGGDDVSWTETLLKEVPIKLLEGISIHHYSVVDWSAKTSSTKFSEEEYFKTMEQAWFMETVLAKNIAVLDKYDKDKKVALIVDEWGTWYETDEGQSALYQQNTIRDAMVAGLTLNIFNNHADRVHMANLAQTLNVLQAIMLTKDDKTVLTPTFYVLEMYKVHQDANLVPISITSKDYSFNDKKIQAVSASASINKKDEMHISLTNIDHKNNQTVTIDLSGYKAKTVSGSIVTSKNIQDYNSFKNPDKIVTKNFKDASLKNTILTVKLPSNAVVVLKLTK